MTPPSAGPPAATTWSRAAAASAAPAAAPDSARPAEVSNTTATSMPFSLQCLASPGVMFFAAPGYDTYRTTKSRPAPRNASTAGHPPEKSTPSPTAITSPVLTYPAASPSPATSPGRRDGRSPYAGDCPARHPGGPKARHLLGHGRVGATCPARHPVAGAAVCHHRPTVSGPTSPEPSRVAWYPP